MNDRTKNIFKEIGEWVLHLGIAIIAGVLIVTFVAQRTVVFDVSMQPTLFEGDNLIVEKISHKLGRMERGDIIVFKMEDEGRQLIKRLIALEGDYVEIYEGKVFVNDNPVDESYLKEGIATYQGFEEYSSMTVPKGHVYVLGDNRPESKDSRRLGPIDIKYISGRAVLRIYPFSRFGFLN